MKTLLAIAVDIIAFIIAFVSAIMGLYALFFGFVFGIEEKQPGSLSGGIGAAVFFFTIAVGILFLASYLTTKLRDGNETRDEEPS